MPDLIGKCSICTGGVSAHYHSAGKYIHVCEQCGAVGLSGFGEALPEIQMIPRQGSLGTPVPADAGTGVGAANLPPVGLGFPPGAVNPAPFDDLSVRKRFQCSKKDAASSAPADAVPADLRQELYGGKWSPGDLPEPAPPTDSAADLRDVARIAEAMNRREFRPESEYAQGWKNGFDAGKLAALSVPVKGAPE